MPTRLAPAQLRIALVSLIGATNGLFLACGDPASGERPSMGASSTSGPGATSSSDAGPGGPATLASADPSGIAAGSGRTGSPGNTAVAASASGSGAIAEVPAGGYPGKTEGCAEGMLRVEGEYCPALMQNCVQHHKEYAGNKDDKNVSERCLKYEDPSHCVSKKRVHLAYCMDRFEYPNRVGELPQVLTSWHQAVKACGDLGKRLCTEDEFNFACEGPEMLPYVYGFVRDETKCNIDKPYIYPDHTKVLPTYDNCAASPFCADEMKRLDQRLKIGERLSCVSWAGLYDLNGNVNEWVNLPGKTPPNRSGLKGGWWGPVRSRCRPTVTFHKENDYGYEAGFRCCKDTAG